MRCEPIGLCAGPVERNGLAMLGEMGRRAAHFWYVVLIGALLSTTLALGILFGLPPKYETARDLLFVPSPTSENPREPVNPFILLGDNLNTAISVISIIVDGKQTKDRLAPPGSGIDYEALQSQTTTAPVLAVEVTAPTPEMADEVADQITRLVRQSLDKQQRDAKAPRGTFVRSTLISSTPEPERVWSTAAQLAVAALAAGFLLTALTVAMLWRHRERRLSAAGEESPGAGSDRPTAAGVAIP